MPISHDDIEPLLSNAQDAFRRGGQTVEDGLDVSSADLVQLPKACRLLSGAQRLLEDGHYTLTIEAAFTSIERSLLFWLITEGHHDPSQPPQSHTTAIKRSADAGFLTDEVATELEELWTENRAHTYYQINSPLIVSESATQETDYMYSYPIQRMVSNARIRRIPQVWHVAILGTIAALPATVLINWLPNSEVTVGGGVMVVGTIIAGALAATRSVAPSAAGLRAGFLGGMIAVSVFLFTEGTTVTWSLNTIAFFLIACVMFLSISPVFGLISGRIGGWVANTVADSSVEQAS